ncbi:MAG: sulfite exporter TauE/SafE family protein [Burkholderiales bacterium]
MSDTLLVLAAALAAGFLDAGVGGGGMLLVPALFAVYPGAPHALLMGTNKLASSPGLGLAVWRYARGMRMPWRVALTTSAAYVCATVAGVTVSRMMPTAVFRLLVPVMLAAMLVYVLTRKDFGVTHAPRVDRGAAAALAIGGVLGFYEGFFGPGSGTLLIFAFVRVFGFDFMHAGAAAKVVNCAGCATAAIVFGVHGEIMWGLALGMASVYIAGAWVGAHVALARGSRWLRMLFVVVASLLIARTGWDAVRNFQGA